MLVNGFVKSVPFPILTGEKNARNVENSNIPKGLFQDLKIGNAINVQISTMPEEANAIGVKLLGRNDFIYFNIN